MSDSESPTPAPTPTCSLLKCPPEIRNRIWTLVAIVKTVKVPCDNRDITSGKYDHPTTMALASTCGQIYLEVTPIYYSKNVFSFGYSAISLLREFAAAIGPANVESITAVEIAIYPPIMHLSQQQLEELWPFPNLKTLVYLEIPVIYGHYPRELHLPRPSSTVAVLRKSRTGRLVKEPRS